MRKITCYILLSFILFPFLVMVYLSVVQSWVFPELIFSDYTVGHWIEVFSKRSSVLQSFINSVAIGLLIATLATLTGYLFSKTIMLSNDGVWRLKWAFYPYLISPVVFGGMMQFYFVRAGWTGTIPGVIIAQALFIIPYSVLLFSTFWSEEIKALIWQARTLGANEKTIDQKILLPLAKPWFSLVFMQCFLISWFEYGITRSIGLGKVHTMTITAMHYIQESNPHRAAIAAAMMFLPAAFLLWVTFKALKKLKV